MNKLVILNEENNKPNNKRKHLTQFWFQIRGAQSPEHPIWVNKFNELT